MKANSPQPGDILLFTNARFFNLFITTLTRSPYFHVGIYLGDGKIIEMRLPGAVRRDLSGRGGAHHFVIIPAPEGQGGAALKWAQTQMSDEYDNIGLVVLALDRIFMHLHLNYTSRNTYTCGSFVVEAFEQAGVSLFPDLKNADVVPGDFSRFVPPHAPVQCFKAIRGRKSLKATGAFVNPSESESKLNHS